MLDCVGYDRLNSLHPSHRLLPKYLVYWDAQRTTDIKIVLCQRYQCQTYCGTQMQQHQPHIANAQCVPTQSLYLHP